VTALHVATLVHPVPSTVRYHSRGKRHHLFNWNWRWEWPGDGTMKKWRTCSDLEGIVLKYPAGSDTLTWSPSSGTQASRRVSSMSSC